MADFTKLKKKKGQNRFGDLPAQDESNNLEAPEVAPVEEVGVKKARGKTGRTVQFATKVTAEFDKKFRTVAFNEGLKHTELLEKCFEAYCEKHDL